MCKTVDGHLPPGFLPIDFFLPGNICLPMVVKPTGICQPVGILPYPSGLKFMGKWHVSKYSQG